MTKYEHLRNKIDNLRRGLAVRNLTAESIRFWESVLHQLEAKLENMTVEQAGKEVVIGCFGNKNYLSKAR